MEKDAVGASRNTRRATGYRVLIATAVLAAGAIAGPAGAQEGPFVESAQAQQQRTFSVSAGTLADALTTFGRQAGLQVSVDPALVQGIDSPGVSGTMSPDQALSRLLAGTGLGYRIVGGNTVTLEKLAQSGALPPGVVQLGSVKVEGQNVASTAAETALGPVNGYIATRSATGAKTDTPLIEIPQSISVVPRDLMVAQNVQNVPQALRYTAGIEAESRGNLVGGADIIFGRGFIMDRYLNGLKLQGGSGYITPQIDVYNLERIEVLRGPASVLYGAASPGGLVNLVNKMPTTAPQYGMFAQGGNLNNFAAGFDVSGPIDDGNTLFYRLTGVARTADNQVQFNKSQRLSISPSLSWRPDADTNVTVMFNYQYDPYVGLYNFVPAAGSVLSNPNGTIPRSFYAGDPNYNTYSRNQMSIGYIAERRLSEMFTLRQNARYMYDDGQLNQVLPSSLAANGYTLNRFNASVNENTSTLSVDTQLQSTFGTGSLSHRLLTGVDYQWNYFNQWLGLGFNVPSINIFAPTYYQRIGGVTPSTIAGQTLTQAGLYAQDQIKFERLSLLLGVRNDWTTTVNDNRMTFTSTTQSDSKVSWRAGMVYEFENGIAPYFSYSTAFQPTIGVTRTGAPFKPVTSEQFEAGIKFQPPGHKTFFMGSVYQITQQNMLTTDPVNVLFQTQTGEVKSQGIEFSATIVPTEGLNIVEAFSYNNPKITQGAASEINHMPAFVPNVLASLWTDYTLQSGPLKGLQFGGGVRYVGFTYATSANDLLIPGYSLVDAMIGYDLGAVSPKLQGVTAAVNATNILNTQYVSECSNATNCLYGQGALVLATLRKKF
ncbi:MAG: TonB-dependent siderophore receptor [Reyranella sp.]|nr:TonB-dependent siderophore receptor [Reyranella sp.]